MRIDILTLFPEMFASVLNSSIVKRAADPALHAERAAAAPASPEDAAASGISGSSANPATPSGLPGPSGPPVSYHLVDIRDYTTNKHHKVDRPPFGGGPGMVIQCQPVWDAVMAAEAQDPRPATRVLMTPQGRRLDQAAVAALATKPRVLIIAGHYEGIDERVIEKLAPIEEVSIGDYVLSGGELPAMVLVDAMVRLIPGVLGDETSAHHDSFSGGAKGLLDHPHYTKPREWMGMSVPEVLLSGDHAKIAKWREEQARERTMKRRPDLLG